MSSNVPTSSIIEPFPALTKAIKNILYPFVYLMMRTGILFPQLVEILKEVYIDVADRQFRLDNKEQTQTRLSFLTGIHRKDIKRLHNKTNASDEPENISMGVKLVSTWIKDKRFLDKIDQPLVLPLKNTKNNSHPSFEELVKTVYKQDIRSRVVLDEWLKLGIVKLDDKKVRLCTEAFIPTQSLDDKAFFLGHNIGDHLNSASQNLLNDSPQFFERCVYYDDLSDDSIANLNTMVKEQGMIFLKNINERAATLKQQDIKRECPKQRINIGLYLYHQNNEETKYRTKK